MNSIETTVQQYIDNQSILGAAVAILQDGAIVYLGGFGMTSVEENAVKVTADTLFGYGSIGKTICATLMMRLVEQRRLELDTPVLQFLPELQFSSPDYGRKITLRHLLSHTTGLPSAGKDWGPRDPDSLRRFVYEQIPHYLFLAEPGTVHLYSNTVFCIAGHVAEAITGMYYDDLVQERVLDPLQMGHTTYDLAVAITHPIALPHEDGPDGRPRVVQRMACNVSGNPSGFVNGSAADLANLAQMYLNQGRFAGQNYLTHKSVAEMHRLHGSRHIEGHAHPLAHVSQGYGLGFYVGQYRGRRAARHGGLSQSYNCFFDLFPDDRAGVILLTNYSQEEPLLELVRSLYDHALGFPGQRRTFLEQPAPPAQPPDTHALQRYAGIYLNVESADLATFVLIDDKLVLERQGTSMSLMAFGDSQFFCQISETYRLIVVFLSDSNTGVSHVMISGNPYFPLALDTAFQADPGLWRAYEGTYKDPSNPNPEEIFRVRVQDGVLYLAEGEHEVACRAISDRSFLSDIGLIEFEDTDSNGVKVLKWGKATPYWRIAPAS